MSGNIFGKLFTVTTFGESHGVAIGAVIDGCPANVPILMEDFQKDLDRRSPTTCTNTNMKSVLSTTRKEKDECKILCGIYKGKTIGSPIAVIVENKDVDPSCYEKFSNFYRPGHADHTYENKFNTEMPTGGARASGRETIGRVIAGTVAKKLLEKNAKDKGVFPITIKTRLKEIAGLHIDDPCHSEKDLPLDISEKIKKIKMQGDSVGCVLECIIENPPCNLGEPVFSKLDATLSQAVMSIGGVKGIEFGSGFACSSLLGSEQNDITKDFNAGIFGGISDGNSVHFSVAVKPVPSIKKKQRAVKKDGSIGIISIEGRHDVCLFPRIIPVIEAMCYITLADFTLLQMRCDASRNCID